MVPSSKCNLIIQSNATSGHEIPHATSYIVLRYVKERYCLAAFTTFYSESDEANNTIERPHQWYVADLESGKILRSYDCRKNDFSNQPFEKKYALSPKKLYSISPNYLDKAFAILDKVRDTIIKSGKLDLNLYCEYLTMIASSIPKEYRIFFRELSYIPPTPQQIPADSQKQKNSAEANVRKKKDNYRKNPTDSQEQSGSQQMLNGIVNKLKENVSSEQYQSEKASDKIASNPVSETTSGLKEPTSKQGKEVENPDRVASAVTDVNLKDICPFSEYLYFSKDSQLEFSKLYHYLRFKKDAAQHKLTVPSLPYYLVFWGENGSGKLSTAKTMLEQFANNGFIKSKSLIITDESMFIGSTVSESMSLLSNTIEKAKGGALYINNAEKLFTIENDPIREACVTYLGKSICTLKDNLFVIFSTSSESFYQLLASKQKFYSLLSYYFQFDKPTPQILINAFIKKLEVAGFTFDNNCVEKITYLFSNMNNKYQLFNGHVINVLIQQVLSMHSYHYYTGKNKEFSIIQDCDIPSSWNF